MDKIISKSLSLSLLMMPALVLTVGHGDSISAVATLLLSLIALIYRYPVKQFIKKEFHLLRKPCVQLKVGW